MENFLSRPLKAIGISRALRYVFLEVCMVIYQALLLPPFRQFFLKILGAKIGENSILMDVRFTNLDRRGLAGLKIGNNCFLGRGVKLDLADSITLEDHVTLAEETMILTHLNVGYEDHPLQKGFPSTSSNTHIGRGSFIGARAIILPGVQIGEEVFVSAGSVVTKSVANGLIVGGIPSKTIGEVKDRTPTNED
jgi:acetyltransferase-like isoleucine patch superfamily enzyme